MSEETEEQAAPPKAGIPWALIGLVGLLSAGSGAAGMMFLGPKPAPAAAEADAEGAGGPAAMAEVAPFSERLLSLDPFVVNVGDEGYPRYLKLQLAFELDSTESRAELEERLPQVRDMTILLLSSKRLSELSDFEGKALLKEDLRDRVGGLLASGSVQSVMFTEFVVQ
jgi:flagellar basal body-associated protein FliL